MRSLQNISTDQANGPNKVLVSLVTTETRVLTSATGNSQAKREALENELKHRADAMTKVLTEIMDRPAAPRFWGLNE